MKLRFCSSLMDWVLWGPWHISAKKGVCGGQVAWPSRKDSGNMSTAFLAGPEDFPNPFQSFVRRRRRANVPFFETGRLLRLTFGRWGALALRISHNARDLLKQRSSPGNEASIKSPNQ